MSLLFTKLAVGVDLSGDGVSVVALGRRLRQVAVLDWLHLESLEGEEARFQVSEFLKRNRLREARVTVCVPRQDLLVRFLELPAEAEVQLKKVVSYQLDVLHPFQTTEVYWDCAVVGREPARKQIRVMVVLGERSRLEAHHQQLRSLGLTVDSLSLFAACLPSLLGKALPGSALVVASRGDTIELLGFRGGNLLAARELSVEPEENAAERFERELHAARADFPAAEVAGLPLFVCGSLPRAFSALLPEAGRLPQQALGLAAPASFDAQAELPALAGAFVGLIRKPAPTINLLPFQQVRPARWRRLPAYALGGTAALLALVLALHGPLETVLYARALDGRIGRLERRAQEAERWRHQGGELAERAAQLAAVREQTWRKLRLLRELTTLLPEDTWVQDVQLNEDTAEIYGYSDRAAELPALLEGSPEFAQVEFTAPITRGADNKEVFRIRMRLESPGNKSSAPKAGG